VESVEEEGDDTEEEENEKMEIGNADVPAEQRNDQTAQTAEVTSDVVRERPGLDCLCRWIENTKERGCMLL
jgi:hypothetical protein